MARSYYNYRSADTDLGASVILPRLFAGIVYAHRAVMLKIEQYAMIAAACRLLISW